LGERFKLPQVRVPGTNLPIKGASCFSDNYHVLLDTPSSENCIRKSAREGKQREILAAECILYNGVQMFVAEAISNSNKPVQQAWPVT
jgi:hypothetical protein